MSFRNPENIFKKSEEEIYKELKEYFGDSLVSYKHQPKMFEHQLKLFLYEKQKEEFHRRKNEKLNEKEKRKRREKKEMIVYES